MFRIFILRWWLRLFSPVIFLPVFLFSPLILNNAHSEDTIQTLMLPRERCSMCFVDAEVKDVLRLLAKKYGLNLIISEEVEGLITLDFDQVPLEDLFYSVLKTAGLGYTRKGDVILIATKKELREEETERVKELEKQRESEKKIMEAQKKLTGLISKMVKVKYILNTKATESIAKEVKVKKGETRNLTQLADSLKTMLSDRKGASIEVVDSANALIITDIPERVEQIVGLIKKLDVPSPQILVEARITLVDSDYARELGVQWGGRAGERSLVISGQRSRTWTQTTDKTTGSASDQKQATFGAQDTGSTFAVDLPAAVKTGKGGAIGFLIGNLNNDFLDIQLSALEDKGRAKLLASPRVITQDNQKAYIKIGDEIPYMERTLGQQITTEVKFKDAAIELEVSPHTVGDEIFMDIVVARKTPDWTRTIEGNPPLRAQALTTKVSVKSGQTFAVGGLNLEEETSTINAVPFFSRIPVLGLLFKKKSKIKTRRELIIFITPTIIKEEA